MINHLLKSAILFLFLGPSLLGLYALNKLTSESFPVFVFVIFGCNSVYNVSKLIILIDIGLREEWLTFFQRGWCGLIFLTISFAWLPLGIYLGLHFFLIAIVWAFLFGIFLSNIAKAEQQYRENIGIK